MLPQVCGFFFFFFSPPLVFKVLGGGGGGGGGRRQKIIHFEKQKQKTLRICFCVANAVDMYICNKVKLLADKPQWPIIVNTAKEH